MNGRNVAANALTFTPLPVRHPGSGGHDQVAVGGRVRRTAAGATTSASVRTDRRCERRRAYQVFVGETPRISSTSRWASSGSAPPFTATRTARTWTVVAPQAGIYPFRLVCWQGGRGRTCSGTRSGIRRADLGTTRPMRARSRRRKARSPARGTLRRRGVASGFAGNDPPHSIDVVLFDGATPVQDA
jgi:hypothetical protein